MSNTFFFGSLSPSIQQRNEQQQRKNENPKKESMKSKKWRNICKSELNRKAEKFGSEVKELQEKSVLTFCW